MSQNLLPPDPMAPQMLNYATPIGRTDLRTVALRQKAIMYCILCQIFLYVLQFALPEPFNVIAALGVIATVVTGAVFICMLGVAIYSTAMGIFLGIITLIPLIGLIVLLVVNGRATKILREHGVRVGLMGADSKQIPAPGQMHLP